MIYNFKSLAVCILVVSTVIFTGACAQLGLDSGTSTNSDGTAQKTGEHDQQKSSISWTSSDFYTIQNDQIIIYGQGISRDSSAAVIIANENAVSNYRMAIRELPGKKLQEITDISDLTNDVSIEILSDKGTFRAFIKAILPR